MLLNGWTLTKREQDELRDSMLLMRQRYEQILQELKRHEEVRSSDQIGDKQAHQFPETRL